MPTILPGALALCVMATAADLHVTVRPGQTATTVIELSKDDLKSEPVLLVRAAPNQVGVTVTGPDGKKCPGKKGDPVEIQIADRNSDTYMEVQLADALNASAYLVGWKGTATPGRYTVHLAGTSLQAPLDVVLHRTTAEGLQKEIASRVTEDWKRMEASMLASPIQRKRLDAQGDAVLEFTGDWQKADAVVVASEVRDPWQASVRLPDGTEATEDNEQISQCFWSSGPRDAGSPLPTTLQMKGNGLSVECMAHLQRGSIRVTLHAGAKNAGKQIEGVIYRESAMAPEFTAEIDEALAVSKKTISLRQKTVDPGEQEGFLSVVAGRSVTTRLILQGGSSPVQEAHLHAVFYKVDPAEYSLTVIGPDKAKTREGEADFGRDENGDFVCQFKGGEPGAHQVDLKATGTLQNGRKFSAETVITVFVDERAASVRHVRQQRIDRTGAGKPDLVRFFVDLDVAKPGTYAASLGVAGDKNRRATAVGQQQLAAGPQTLVAEGPRELIDELEKDPKAEVGVEVNFYESRPDRKFAAVVTLDAPAPHAGEFETVAAERSAMNAGGATWSLADGELGATFPVTGWERDTRWSETLEISPKQVKPGQTIRTVAYQQTGVLDGSGKVASVWSLAPFFEHETPPDSQRFVLRLTELRNAKTWRENIAELAIDADLRNVSLKPVVDHGDRRMPHIAGLATVEPYDKDGRGAFDRLRVSFDLVSPGGACTWEASIGDRTSGQGYGEIPTQETSPGVNHVVTGFDISTNVSFRDVSLFHFYVTSMKCGVRPVFTQEEREKAMMERTMLFDQDFAIDPARFAPKDKIEVPPSLQSR
ncbi:MAG TPA: hypothetical protein VMJ34_18225 [Bryobacteraceae bacterium]|nr:hypothetical protein [Bryobacteraceae bacterium]